MSTTVKLNHIKPDVDNVRADVGDVSELAASIASEGLLQPIVVRQNGSPDSYIVVAGHRRLAALESIGVTELIVGQEVIVRSYDDEASITVAQLIENLQRVDISPVEEAKGYARLVQHGMKQKDLAARIGRNASHVSKRLALLTLPAEALVALDDGAITIEGAVELAKIKDEDEVRGIVTIAVEHQANGWDFDVADAAREVVEDEKRAALLDKAKATAEKHGMTVLSQQDIAEKNRQFLAAEGTPGERVEVTTWMLDHDRSFEAGTIGEAKLKRSDVGVTISMPWNANVPTLTPVFKGKDERYLMPTGSTASTSTPVDPDAIRIPYDKREAATTKALNAWVLAQDQAIVAGKVTAGDVNELVKATLMATAGVEVYERAAKLLQLDPEEMPTKDQEKWVRDPNGGSQQVRVTVQVPDKRAAVQDELTASGARQLRAFHALCLATLEGDYYGRAFLDTYREEHDFVTFDRPGFEKEWEATYVEKEKAKRAKAAAAAEAEADDDEGLDADLDEDVRYEGSEHPEFDG